MSQPLEDSKSYSYRFGQFELDEAHLLFKQNAVAIPMPAKPWSLLLLLLRHAPAVVTHKEIHDAVWHQRAASPGVVNQVVTRLRQMLGDDDQALIKNVHGIGFCFTGDLGRELQHRESSACATEISASTRLRGRQPWKLLQPVIVGGNTPAWLGEHQGTQERRVFKFAFDAAGKSNLKKEVLAARLLADERDDGYLPVLHWDFAEPPYFIETPFVEGGTLQEWIAQQAGVAVLDYEPRALALIQTVASVMTSAHATGLIHGDLSPKNVLIRRDESGEYALLSDFGSAQVRAAERIRLLELSLPMMPPTGISHSSTLIYAAPELLRGAPASEATDVYAFGVLLFQTLARDTHRTLSPGWEAVIAEPLLRADILALCAPEPGERLSASAAFERLAQLNPRRAAQHAQETLNTQARLIAAHRRKRRRYLVAMAALALITLLTLAGWMRAFQLQREASANLVRARQGEEKAQALLKYLGNTVYARVPKDIMLLDALKQSFATAQSELKDRPDLQADLYVKFAEAFVTLGEYELGQQAINRAGELPKLDIEVAANLKFVRGQFLYLNGMHEQAKPALRDAVIALRPTQDANRMGICLVYLADIALMQGDLPAAWHWFEQIDTTHVPANEARWLLNNRDAMAGRYFEQNRDWAQAETHFQAILQRSEGQVQLNVNQSGLRGIARLQAARGEYPAAIKNMELAISNMRAIDANSHRVAELEYAVILAEAGEQTRSITVLKRLVDPKLEGRFFPVFRQRAQRLLHSLTAGGKAIEHAPKPGGEVHRL